MTKQPAATDLDVGVSEFPTTFDTVTSQTRALTEFGKVAYSEPGSIYLRKDTLNGETLVFENSQHWNGLKELDQIPTPASSSGKLLQENGDYLLQESGYKILLNQIQSLNFNDLTIDEETEHGEQVINRFTAIANPRKVDTTAQVLFTLNEPILIGSGQTIVIRGTYADPSGGLPINANPTDMITPVATTDYLVNTLSDGSGTNLTSSLVLVDITYGSEGFTHTVKNNSSNTGYITKWSPRGKGIYQYNPIEHVETNSDSISSDWGTQPESINQAYQTQLVQGTLFGKQVIFEYSEPQQILTKIHFNPNSSPELMSAFLNGDVGSYFPVTITNKNIDENVAVRGVQFTLNTGGIIMCTWIVKCIRSLLKGLSSIAVEFRGGSTSDAINFGVIPHILNLTTKSYSFWMKADAIPVGTSDAIFQPLNNDNGVGIFLTVDGQIQYYSLEHVTNGIWKTPNSSIAIDTWYHIVVTRDVTTYTNDPVIYINGVSQTVTEAFTPSGARKSEDGVQLTIGNVGTDYSRAFDGKLRDLRVYDRILSSTEVTTLYNSGTPDSDLVTDGLIFRAFAVKTKNLSNYIDQTLDENLTVVDDIYGMVGTPNGSPVGRTF